MNIAEILESKVGPAPAEVLTCEDTREVIDAIRLLAEHNIGAVVVTRGDDIAGIFSERDVVRHCLDEQSDFRHKKLREIMSQRVLDIKPDQTVDEALLLMKENNIRHLPVVADEKMIGFLSMRDLMIAKIDRTAQKAEFMQGQIHAANNPLPM